MGRTAREKKPRALGGGRSERYESRRVARKAERAYAPSWSDAAAAAVLDHLHKESAREGKQIVEYTRTMLTSAARARELREGVSGSVSPADRQLIASIIQTHASAIAKVRGAEGIKKKVICFLKPLRERRAARADVTKLEVPRLAEGPATFHLWLAEDPTTERMRDISQSPRILTGLARWPIWVGWTWTGLCATRGPREG